MSPREAYLALNLIPNVGPVRVRRLLEVFGDPASILRAPADRIRAIEGFGSELATALTKWEDTIDIQVEIRKVREKGLKVLITDDANYPAPLREIHNPPLVLYVWGELTEADRHAVALVGSRNCTHYGRKTAQKFAFQLGHAGYTVISGMARGIDTAAHEGAVASKGRTVAVLGSGIGQLYPPENEALARRIIEGGQGAVVSEFPVDYPPDRQSFPLRNRIVSGWSCGVVVIEAAQRSGALITANMAAEQGRSVYAVPGPIDRPSSQGCNRLIQDGARLVMDGTDIVDDLNLLFPVAMAREAPELFPTGPLVELSETEQKVYDAIGDGEEVSIDDITTGSGLSGSEVSALLMRLEMKRLVKPLPGSRYVKLIG